MNAMNNIVEFGKAHAGVIAIGFAWFIREWSTFGGWRGLKGWFLTGRTTTPVVAIPLATDVKPAVPVPQPPNP